MRVLMVQGSYAWSGGEAVSLAIADGAPTLETSFVLPGVPDQATLARYGSHAVRFPASGSFRDVVRGIRDAIRATEPDVVHAHGTRTKFLLSLALLGIARKERPRTMYTVHGFHIAQLPLLKRLLAFAIERASNRLMDSIVTTSEADRDLVLRTRTAPAAKVSVIPNGIDIPRYASGDRARGRKTLGIGDEPVALIVARLHPQKDIGTALAAWERVHREMPEAVLLINGDGPLEDELKADATRRGLGESVRFLGHRGDVPDLLSASDVVVLPTHWEGMALVPIESGAASRPVVATDVPGMNETVAHGETGYLVRHEDAEDLAVRILELLGDPERARLMGEAGYRRVTERFANARMAAEYAACYARLISG